MDRPEFAMAGSTPSTGRQRLPSAEEVQPAAAASRNAALAAARVVVVDDDPSSLRLLQAVLHKIGVGEIHLLADPRSLRAAMGGDTPDLVVLDWHMPGLTGAENLAAIRSQFLEDEYVPILVLTADSTKEARDAALAAGADDFLTKPFDITEVRFRVRNLLRTRRLHARLEEQRRMLAKELREHEERVAELQRWQEATAERITACLQPGGIKVVYQPIVELASGDVVGAEALSRFEREPTQTPDRWFADAAEVGLGVEMDLAAVQTALARLDQLPADAFLSVNVSPVTLVDPRLAAVIPSEAAERIVLELTEHTPIEDYEPASRAIIRLRSRGVRLAVDDAGAGFSSLRHILRLSPDVIKLDLALTRDVDSDPVRRALAEALISFAADVGALIVAEGIETTAELETLRGLGIMLGQGFRLARPNPPPVPAEIALGAA